MLRQLERRHLFFQVGTESLIAIILCVSAIVSNTVVGFAPSQHEIMPSKTSLRATWISSRDDCDVAVFGGGFGGLYTALALSNEARAKGKRLDIALVDPSERFIFLPLLYDLVMGTASEEEVCPTYRELLQESGIRHLKGNFDNFASSDVCSANLTGLDGNPCQLSFRASVLAVGATPQSTLASVPGALEYAQPFYTRDNAKETKFVLEKLERRARNGLKPRIAVVGGGYGGVELATCVKRRIPDATVSLLTRGPPMKGTKAEPLIDKALARLGINVQICGVESVQPSHAEETPNQKVSVKTKSHPGEMEETTETWDVVLWTAGSGPAYPVCENVVGLKQVNGSGRIQIDNTLRCVREEASQMSKRPRVWSLGDCSQIVDATESFAVPKTAQAAIQQADVVATNVLSELFGDRVEKQFQFQDLGSMLSLGGPNGAVLAPSEGSALAPLFTTLLDTTRMGLGLADEVFVQLSKSPAGSKVGIGALVENLNLSLGGYGLGVDADSAPGTLSGTLSGAARRAVYAIRMPTNRQRAKSAILGALATATALGKEMSEQITKKDDSER